MEKPEIGVPNLIAQLKEFSNILAEDVKRVNEGKTDGFILLDDAHKLSRILNILKNLEYFEALEYGRPEKSKPEKPKKEDTDSVPTRKRNIQQLANQ